MISVNLEKPPLSSLVSKSSQLFTSSHILSVKTGYNWKVDFQNAVCCIYIEKIVITGSLFNMLYTDAKILSFSQEQGIHYFVSSVVIVSKGQKSAFGIKLSLTVNHSSFRLHAFENHYMPLDFFFPHPLRADMISLVPWELPDCQVQARQQWCWWKHPVFVLCLQCSDGLLSCSDHHIWPAAGCLLCIQQHNKAMEWKI